MDQVNRIMLPCQCSLQVSIGCGMWGMLKCIHIAVDVSLEQL